MFLDKYLGYTFFARDLRMSGYIKVFMSIKML